MANRKSKQPTKTTPKPIGDARKILLEEIAAAVEKYKKSCKCDDEDAVGVIFGWLFVRAFFYSEIRPWLSAIDGQLKAVCQWSKELGDIDCAMEKRYGPRLIRAVENARLKVGSKTRDKK